MYALMVFTLMAPSICACLALTLARPALHLMCAPTATLLQTDSKMEQHAPLLPATSTMAHQSLSCAVQCSQAVQHVQVIQAVYPATLLTTSQDLRV